jgi:hypothetical protein
LRISTPHPALSAIARDCVHEASQPPVQLTWVAALAQLLAQLMAFSVQVMAACCSVAQLGDAMLPLASQVKFPGMAAQA